MKIITVNNRTKDDSNSSCNIGYKNCIEGNINDDVLSRYRNDEKSMKRDEHLVVREQIYQHLKQKKWNKLSQTSEKNFVYSQIEKKHKRIINKQKGK